MADRNDNDGGRRRSRLRIAAWSAAALLLLLPLIAMQLTDEVNWTAGDFAFAGALILGVGGAWELVVRRTRDTVYRSAVALALTGVFLLVWINAAVGITDSGADKMFILVVAVGIAGASVALFRPAAMAGVMFATALALASVGVIALIAGVVPAHNSAFEILGLTGFFAAMFVGSALLFRKAAHRQSERSAI